MTLERVIEPKILQKDTAKSGCQTFQYKVDKIIRHSATIVSLKKSLLVQTEQLQPS